MFDKTLAILIINAVLVTACAAVTPAPTSQATATVFPTRTALSPTPIRSQPTAIPTSTKTDKIRLYHNQTATRFTSDRYSFSVVLDKDADFIPKFIQIIELKTHLVIGGYELFDQTKIESLCANLMQNPDLKFYETPLVDYSSFPKSFIIRAYRGEFIFRISIEYSSGKLEMIEKTMPDNGCATSVT